MKAEPLSLFWHVTMGEVPLDNQTAMKKGKSESSSLFSFLHQQVSVFFINRSKVLRYLRYCVMVMSLRYRKDKGISDDMQKKRYVLQHEKRLHKQKKYFYTYL